LAGNIGMTADRGVRTMLALCVIFLAVTALYLARAVLAPVSFALFVIAIVWPVQRALQTKLPKMVALAVTILLTLFVITSLVSMIAWGFGQAAQWLINNGGRLQALYSHAAESLEHHGVFVAGLWAEHFNVRWLILGFQQITGRVQSLFSFGVVTLIFTILGLLEVEATTRKLRSLPNQQALLAAGSQTAAKLQKYMVIRTVVSLLTGVVIWAFISLAGLDLAVEWGVIAFAMNYIPFIGPLVATVFPTLFAILQFGAWETALTVFLSLNLIQFLSGSYFEPRIAGASLSISPFIVLFAVLFWSFLWGIPGAFIGVPITIALVTVCAQYPSSRWIATLLSAGENKSPVA
jgi:AI-2 transport protein TqsA